MRHYGYNRDDAAEHLAHAANVVQSGWHGGLSAEGILTAAIENYRGTFSPLP